MNIKLTKGVNGLGKPGDRVGVARPMGRELIAQNRAILVPREQKAVPVVPPKEEVTEEVSEAPKRKRGSK